MTGRYERQLLGALEATGYAGMRAPASGGATDRDLPDLLVGTCAAVTPLGTYADALAIELKTTSSTTAYLDDSEITALERFAHDFGATPLLAVKFKRAGGTRSGYWLVPTTATRRTDSGRHGLPVSDIEERAVKVVYPATDAKDAEVREP